MIRRRTPSAKGSLTRLLASIGLSIGVAIIGATACGGKDAGPPVLLDDFARELANALCSNLGPCCESAGFPFEQEKCRTNYEAEVATQFTRYKVEGVAYDANAARRCVDAFAAAAQQCRDIDDDPQGCDEVFRGIKKEGEPCTAGFECESRFCRRTPDGADGTCDGPRLHGNAGDPCFATCSQRSGSSTCSSSGGSGTPPPMTDGLCFTEDGLFCSQANVCEALVPIGGACRSFHDCAGDVHCDQGTCATRTATGPCQTPNACTASSYCDFTAQQCRPRKARGQACVSTGECDAADTCSNGTCQRSTVANARTCAGNL